MIAAYDALFEPFRRLPEGLKTVHDRTKAFRRSATGGARRRPSGRRPGARTCPSPPGRPHPPRHREEGHHVNASFTTRILDLSPKENDAVLRLFFEHVAKLELTVRWRWRPGDVAFWDPPDPALRARRLPAPAPGHAPGHDPGGSAAGPVVLAAERYWDQARWAIGA